MGPLSGPAKALGLAIMPGMKPIRSALPILCFLLCACMPPSLVKDRLDLIEAPASCPADTLIVLLPGAYDTAEDFQRHGFAQAVQRHGVAADLVMADAHIGYYNDDLIVERLQRDIVEPARRKGYRRIWLAGISLGGYGSLLYAKRHGTEISGMFLMAPFLGNRSLIAEVQRAGGLAAWQPGQVSPADYDRRLWAWLKGYAPAPGAGEERPPLVIGYGLSDRFAGSNALLAASLPDGHAFTTEGGHDWAPWRRLWDDFLGRKFLPKCAQPDRPD